ncbi:hypothetical protein Tco_0634016 [Tanacetum coccineum]
MFLYVDQLEKQLDKEEFQEIGSMASFKVLETQFQMFIKSRMYMDDEYVVMTHNYFLQYTQLEIPEFHDTLIQHMESVKKSIDERAKHKQEYNSWVNERQMQTTEDKVDSSKALDASLVDTESSGTTLKEQDTSSRSGNDAHADDADIRPIYDEEPMAEVPSHKTMRYKPVEQIRVAKKPERQIPKRHRSSIKKTSVVHEKTMTARSCLRWKPMSKIFKTVGLRWVPTGKIFTSSTTKFKAGSKNVPPADKTATSRQELELLLHHP